MNRLIALLLLVSSGLPLAARADSKPAPIPATPAGPKSVFVDEVEFGKDPFFPRSSRRPKVVAKVSDPEPLRGVVPNWVVLKGISVLKDKKLAIVNNRTVGEGEEFSLKSAGQVVQLKCVEIKEASVVVNYNGATKELPLRAGP